MSELAPWESGDGPQKPGAKGSAKPGTGVYRLPPDNKLPEVYKPDSQAFIAPAGRAVPRPPRTPRPLEARARMAFIVLGSAVAVGLLAIALTFVVLGDAGNIRFVYVGLGAAISVLAGIVIAIEFPRLNTYRNTHFMPGVLVYGNRAQMEKVAGPAGVGTINMATARGIGTGLLNKVFDRSARIASPPDVVALHCDRGNGPEFVGIEWDAVREFQRGDIVWFHMKSPMIFLMFHKMIPFAPSIQTDKATRDEIFTALRVGSNMYQERPTAKAMGQTKVFQTDADGKIVAPGARAAAPLYDPNAPVIPLADPSGPLGGDQQYYQGAPGEITDDKPRGSSGKTHLFRIGEPGKPLGGHDVDPGVDDADTWTDS